MMSTDHGTVIMPTKPHMRYQQDSDVWVCRNVWALGMGITMEAAYYHWLREKQLVFGKMHDGDG
jgi:hypothetical protein